MSKNKDYVQTTIINYGYNPKIISRLVSDDDLANPAFIRDLRKFTASLGLKPSAWLDYLANAYCRYEGRIVLSFGEREEVLLNLDLFEMDESCWFAPDGEKISDKEAEAYRVRMHNWFKEYCNTPCPDHATPRLRPETKERVRTVATILRAVYPKKALLWGVRAVNDNEPNT